MIMKPPQGITPRVACIVLAGGQGTRLFPLTQARCKPAVAFGGRYRLIDIPLSHALNAKIQNVYVISQYLASGLHQHILETYQLDPFHDSKIHLLSPEETLQGKGWYNGTADAVRQNLEHFTDSSAEYFLILSGDQLYNMDLHKLLEFAWESDADLVIASLPVEVEEAKRMGLLKIDTHQQITAFAEKPKESSVLASFQLDPVFLDNHPHKNRTHPHYLGSMGIYVFKRKALFDLLQQEGDDFGRNLIPLQVKKGKASAFVYTGYWEDIGTIESYYHANLALLSQNRCLDTYDTANPIFTHPYHLPSPLLKETLVNQALISQGSLIEAKEITHSIIGLRVHIQKGTIIRHSIVIGNPSHPPTRSTKLSEFSIGAHCHIEKAIIDEHTHIGNHVSLINKQQIRSADINGIFIRDGIIIVPSGARIPDHFTL